MTEVFRTPAGAVVQSDGENCFYLQFRGRQTRLEVCALVALKQRVDHLDLVEMLTDVRRADVEVISTCRPDELFVLTLHEIIALKELLAGTLVMLELNSILHRRLRCSLA